MSDYLARRWQWWRWLWALPFFVAGTLLCAHAFGMPWAPIAVARICFALASF